MSTVKRDHQIQGNWSLGLDWIPSKSCTKFADKRNQNSAKLLPELTDPFVTGGKFTARFFLDGISSRKKLPQAKDEVTRSKRSGTTDAGVWRGFCGPSRVRKLVLVRLDALQRLSSFSLAFYLSLFDTTSDKIFLLFYIYYSFSSYRFCQYQR